MSLVLRNVFVIFIFFLQVLYSFGNTITDLSDDIVGFVEIYSNFLLKNDASKVRVSRRGSDESGIVSSLAVIVFPQFVNWDVFSLGFKL